MAAFVLVRKDSYHDSVLLMRISEALKHLAGVEDAVVAMATPQNRELLEAQGYRGPELAAAGPNDLVIAVKGDAGAAKTVEAALDELLRSEGRDVADEVLPATLAAALKAHPEANLVLISAAGRARRPRGAHGRWRWACTSWSSPTTSRSRTRSRSSARRCRGVSC